MEAGARVFLGLPSERDERVLCPGTVEVAAMGLVATVFDRSGFGFTPGDTIVLFYHEGGRFMQQRATVETVRIDGERTTLVVEPVGEPESAQDREGFRVPVSDFSITAKFAAEESCQVVDLSATGFALRTSLRYTVGRVIRAVLHTDDGDFKGRVAVRHVEEVDNGFVCGLECLEPESAELRGALLTNSRELQRRYLARRGATEG